MPYDPIQGQGQGQGHECLRATQEESTFSPARTGLIFCSILDSSQMLRVIKDDMQ